MLTYHKTSYLLAVCVLLAAPLSVLARWNIPFFTASEKQYTPLVFFTAPPGLIPEVDAMEKAVRKVEKELGVKVERLDVLRDPVADACLKLLTRRRPPFLYHRLTCKTVSIPKTSGKGKEDVSVTIDLDRVRSWAKGRFRILSETSQPDKVRAPILLSTDDDNAIDQSELLEDMTLTPRQREGKKKIKERTYQEKRDE